MLQFRFSPFPQSTHIPTTVDLQNIHKIKAEDYVLFSGNF